MIAGSWSGPPNQEITPAESGPVFIHRNTNMESPLGERSFRGAQGVEDLLQAGQGREATEFVNDVVFRPGDDKALPDRSASLRDHRTDDHRAGQSDTDEAVAVNVVIEKEAIFSKVAAPTCQPS